LEIRRDIFNPAGPTSQRPKMDLTVRPSHPDPCCPPLNRSPCGDRTHGGEHAGAGHRRLLPPPRDTTPLSLAHGLGRGVLPHFVSSTLTLARLYLPLLSASSSSTTTCFTIAGHHPAPTSPSKAEEHHLDLPFVQRNFRARAAGTLYRPSSLDQGKHLVSSLSRILLSNIYFMPCLCT
jgi:hypothetical protein